MAKQNPPILFEDCPDLLLTTCPDSLVQSVQLVNGLVRRARTHEHKGSAIYELNRCREVDAGAILLLMHGGYRLARQGWQACVAGQGEAMDLIARHLEHYLRAKGDRSDCPREEGDYLLREIRTPAEMVEEISEWADSVQQETTASGEQVALWKFQISEVTTNGFQHGLAELEEGPPAVDCW